MTMFAGFSIGAALGGLLAAALIPAFGWRSVFLVGGLAPLVLLPFLLIGTAGIDPVSGAGRRPRREVRRSADEVSRQAGLAPARHFVVQEPKLSGLPVAHLFAEGRGRSRCCSGSCSS